MPSHADADVVKQFAKLGDLAGVQKFASPDFDWNLGGHDHLPALHEAIMWGAGCKSNKNTESKVIQTIEWILKAGADPCFKVLPVCKRHFMIYPSHEAKAAKDYDQGISVTYAGHTAVSLCGAIIAATRRSTVDYSKLRQYFQLVLHTISGATSCRGSKAGCVKAAGRKV